MVARLLVPLDGSKMAESMLQRLRSLLSHPDARVTLFGAVAAKAEADFIGAAMANESAKPMRRYLERIATQLKARGIQVVKTRVEVGDVAATILDVAAEERSSLICLSTHGRSGLDRLRYGSVTEKVVRVSEQPVLVVPSFDRTEPEGGIDRREWRFRSIVVALDGSRRALKLVPHVAELSGVFDASVTLLLVLEDEPDEEREKAARRHLEGATKLFAEAGVTVESVIRNGDPVTEILDYVPRYDHDLIMMTTHGRSGLSRWMLGSVTEKVVRHATVPVMVVRSTGED
jgi:nucleotide-binding universal stress UspA family protein